MESITHPIREGMLQLRRAGSRDFQSLHSLDDICLQMLNDIESFESQIQESSEVRVTRQGTVWSCPFIHLATTERNEDALKHGGL